MSGTRFPQGFFWGASTAAYQVEGGIDNTDWAKAAREGRVPPAGKACDFYHHYEQDLDIAKSLGMNAQRFSIEWARIEPEEGRFDAKEIEHYRRVLQAVRARGMKPVVNLWHFTLPLWFSERGGFLHRDAAKCFARYCAHVVKELDGETDIWLTINEPEIWALNGYLKAKWPPFRRNPLAYLRVQRALARAHRAAYEAMKTTHPNIRVGIAKHNIFFEADRNPFNKLVRAFVDRFWNHSFFWMTKGCHDVIGLNHYFRRKFGANASDRAQLTRSDMGWELHPTSLYECLKGLRRYGVPVFVSEHGLADAKDAHRAEFLRNAERSLVRALGEGVPVEGYFYWSLLDNYEWAHGYGPRFGLIAVDYSTQARTVRQSAYVYKELIERNRAVE